MWRPAPSHVGLSPAPVCALSAALDSGDIEAANTTL